MSPFLFQTSLQQIQIVIYTIVFLITMHTRMTSSAGKVVCKTGEGGVLIVEIWFRMSCYLELIKAALISSWGCKPIQIQKHWVKHDCSVLATESILLIHKRESHFHRLILTLSHVVSARRITHSWRYNTKVVFLIILLHTYVIAATKCTAGSLPTQTITLT